MMSENNQSDDDGMRRGLSIEDLQDETRASEVKNTMLGELDPASMNHTRTTPNLPMAGPFLYDLSGIQRVDSEAIDVRDCAKRATADSSVQQFKDLREDAG